MVILLIAYLGGVLTILSPCILPVLPFVFARADRPFIAHGLRLLGGMALAFACVATLAAVGGTWAIAASQTGRYAALALFAFFGLALLRPRLAEWLSRPLVALGLRLSARGTRVPPFMLGIGTGLLWAPCAGPILGLILTGAALNGASLGTSLLLLAYAGGACTSLAVALLAGGRLLSALKATLRNGERLRRVGGAAVLASAGAIALGLDTSVLSGLSIGTTSTLEQGLVDRLAGREPRRADADAGQASDDGGFLLAADRQDAPLPRPRSDSRLPSLDGASEWINSAPIGAESLRGKVVLVDFWTYSCINCLRTVPYVRAWAEKYKGAGLVVIGVHTPEFAFEKRAANVRRAAQDLRIDFPVAIDNDYAVWRAFGNQAWPALYFIDAQGHIRYRQLGEGRYDTAERVIQQLLAEAGPGQVPGDLVQPKGQGVQAAPGTGPVLSGETYLGHARAEGYALPGGLARDRVRLYPAAPPLRTNQWSLSGEWAVDAERAVLHRPNGRIAYRFHARDVHLVLGPSEDGKPVRFKVLLDGKPPLADRGADVDEQGVGTIDAQRLYQLVRQAGSRERLFEIEFLDAGAQAYAFTFG
jgi:cytochrome c biogenesis protein CcdA/thiol-disulfide isomerase/thioredoxin